MDGPRLTADERQRHAARMDRSERSERMLTEIILGVPKAESLAIADDEDARLWDAMVADIAKLPPGAVIDYGIPSREDHWGPGGERLGGDDNDDGAAPALPPAPPSS